MVDVLCAVGVAEGKAATSYSRARREGFRPQPTTSCSVSFPDTELRPEFWLTEDRLWL